MTAILARSRTIPDRTASDHVAEANHRIANSLTLLVSMVRMQARSAACRSDPVSAADLRLALEGVAARIGTIGQLHRMLSHAPHDGVTALKPHLAEVSATLVGALSSPEQPVRVDVRGQDCLVPTRQVQPLVLILCETFINAMKYAHPAGVPLVVTAECFSDADGRLVLSIRDDGVGLPDGFDPVRDGGLGFRVIRGLAGELGAEMGIESSELGLCFRLSLPTSARTSGKLS
jgi:two-component sensor histidine kinase